MTPEQIESLTVGTKVYGAQVQTLPTAEGTETTILVMEYILVDVQEKFVGALSYRFRAWSGQHGQWGPGGLSAKFLTAEEAEADAVATAEADLENKRRAVFLAERWLNLVREAPRQVLRVKPSESAALEPSEVE